jgi:hypothetical protein
MGTYLVRAARKGPSEEVLLTLRLKRNWPFEEG